LQGRWISRRSPETSYGIGPRYSRLRRILWQLRHAGEAVDLPDGARQIAPGRLHLRL